MIKKFVASVVCVCAHTQAHTIQYICICGALYVLATVTDTQIQAEPSRDAQSRQQKGIVLIEMGPMPCEPCYKSFKSQTERGLNSILQLTVETRLWPQVLAYLCACSCLIFIISAAFLELVNCKWFLFLGVGWLV